MADVFGFLANQPILLVFLLIGIGMVFGQIKVKGISLGAAAVLFAAIGVAAWGKAYGIDVVIPHELGILGLVIFTFAMGNNSGPSFFENIKKAIGPMATMVLMYGITAAVGYAVGKLLFDMDIALIAGTFAGATTNTPALAAAGESTGDPGLATVGYSIAYVFGVLGMMVAALMALRKAASDTDKPEPVANLTIRVDREDQPRLGNILKTLRRPVEVSRLRRGDGGPVWIPTGADILEKGDVMIVVGAQAELDQLAETLGHPSTSQLRLDRRFLDYRRITVSETKIAGMTIGDVEKIISERFGATISRVRRGDTDLMAIPDFMLEMGDRVRVIAPSAKLKDVSRFFGDSSKGMTDLNPVALGLGIGIGILLGAVKIPIPGGSSFGIGAAAGALIVGLIFGRAGRVSKMITALPNAAAAVLAEFGLLVFLAQAGTNAGGQIAKAFSSGAWWQIFVLGAVMTTTLAIGLYLAMRHVFKMGGTQLSGLLAGAQTQPAVLAFANSRTGTDPRVALGYALVYPMAMIGKILVATILGFM